MAPSIKELDGLPAGEIKLLVAESEQRIMEAVEERLTAQDTKLDTMQADLSILVGTAKLTGLVQSTKSTLETLAQKHEEWHEADLTFRDDIKTRMSTLETNNEELAQQVSVIRWFVVCSHGLGWTLAKCTDVLKSEEFWKVVGVAFVFYFLSKFTPSLYHWLQPILSLTK